MAVGSSHTKTFGSVAGLTGVSMKTTSEIDDPSKNMKDATTLSNAHKADRVWQSAPLFDTSGAAVSGIVTTVTLSFFSDSPPELGDIEEGLTCIDVTEDYKVGEFVTGSATFQSTGD